MASITFLKGANQGMDVQLTGDRIVLGRNADCHVVLNVPAVSREHAVIHRLGGKYYLEDLKSRNGTFLNNQEVTGRALLKDNDRIKICDNLLAFFEAPPRPPLPDNLRSAANDQPEQVEDGVSTVEATISQSSKQILQTQPAEKLTFLLDITNDLTQTLNLETLLPKIIDRLFAVFRQADRGFIILSEEDKLIPKVIKTRRATEEGSARFSRKIVNSCLETTQALLSEDVTADQRFDLSQSMADCRIRSVMCAPLLGPSTGQAFGVLQLDSQDRSKKFTQGDLELLLAVAGQAAVAMENAQLHENLVARAGIERDLATARQVQLSFLPKRLPKVANYEFFAHYESAQEVGGDYYDFIPLPSAGLGIMIGDVSGKGVPAALLMAKISSDARFCVLTEKNIAAAVARLNELIQEAGLLDKFVTLEAGLLDPIGHQVTFVNAGHLPPLLYRQSTGTIEEAISRELAGFPLGVADGCPYDAVTVPLEPGDSIVLFSDGVTEAKNKDEVEFQLPNTIATLRQGPMTPKAMGTRLVAAVKEFAKGRKPHDDLTVICFGRQLPSAPPKSGVKLVK